MNKRVTLEQADRDLKEASTQFDALKMHIQRLDQDIFEMVMFEKGIEEHISILKETSTIPLTSEYKRSKTELAAVKNRLIFLRVDKVNHGKMLVRAEQLLKEKRQTYDDLVSAPKGVVIQGKFGRDSGQE